MNDLAAEFRFDRTVFSTVSSFEEAAEADNRYWWAQSPEKRLRALEYMRQVAYGYDPATIRLQRVFEAAEQA